MARDEWIEAFAIELGAVPPSSGEIDTLLELAAVAAHTSERTAAPLSCWLAAQAARSPAEALAAAQRLAAATHSE